MRSSYATPSRALTIAFVATLMTSGPSFGASEVRALQYNPATDNTITALGGLTLLGSELLKGTLAPANCHWCDRNADGTDSLNSLDQGVRTGLRWPDTATANTLSHIGAYVLVPTAALGLTALAANHTDTFGVDSLVILQSAILTQDLNQIVKFATGRERPFVHVLPADQKSSTSSPSDNNTSFFSGHTSLAFSLAVSSGTVASLRGYEATPWIWGAGLTLAFVTGYLRIAADKHYFTDVLTGAVIGSFTGFAIPYFLHHPANEPAQRPAVSAALLNQGGTIQLTWGF